MRISRYLLVGIGILGAACLLPVQVPAQASHIRASVSGPAGVAAEEGRCTFEVEVDGAAHLEIHGDQADLITTSGQPARWRRLECTSMMPSHPANFQFRGIDGRGSQRLIREPNSSGGVAVILIEDPKAGSEGYTGEISWHGGRNFFGGAGNWGAGPEYRPQYSRPEWEHRINRADAANICRNQVADTRHVARNAVSLQLGPPDERLMNMRFSYVNGYGRTKSGTCSVSPQGEIVNFQIDEDRPRITWNQALNSCQGEAARQFGVPEEDIRVQHGLDPGNGSYLINYQALARDGRIRTGSCRVSPFGEMEDFRRW